MKQVRCLYYGFFCSKYGKTRTGSGTAKNVILFLLIRLIKQSMILSTLFSGYLVKMYKNLCRKTAVVFIGKYLSFGKYGLCRLKLRVR